MCLSVCVLCTLFGCIVLFRVKCLYFCEIVTVTVVAVAAATVAVVGKKIVHMDSLVRVYLFIILSAIVCDVLTQSYSAYRETARSLLLSLSLSLLLRLLLCQYT